MKITQQKNCDYYLENSLEPIFYYETKEVAYLEVEWDQFLSIVKNEKYLFELAEVTNIVLYDETENMLFVYLPSEFSYGLEGTVFYHKPKWE